MEALAGVHQAQRGSQQAVDEQQQQQQQQHADSEACHEQQQQPVQLYNLVLASEVLEHVKRPDQFCSTLAQLATPGGTVVISTLNRTPASFALGILGAEYIARVVPRCARTCRRLGLHNRAIVGVTACLVICCLTPFPSFP